MASTKTKNDESSIANAPQLITPACFKIAGIAMLPIAEAPAKNFVAFTQLLHVFVANNNSDNKLTGKEDKNLI